ncbi:MAG TPA: hypothetical protein VK826_00950 [Bacteroidia bacterium]|nr:hypothetical protein [Bacteroidia bacterium]
MMKNLGLFLTGLAVILTLGFRNEGECGDGTVYANKDQTENDSRFDAYTKIKGVPEYKDGDKKLDALIKSKLVLADSAKSQVFNLNYQFTVTCDGKIKDFKTLGNSRMASWTNIAEIIQGTEADWTPAKKGKDAVDCIYFRKLFINGNDY